MTRAYIAQENGSMQHQIIREVNRINRLTKNRRYAQIEALEALRKIYATHQESHGNTEGLPAL